MKNSRLVVITGPDGSGKSSVIADLVRILNEKNGQGFAKSASVWDSMIASKVFEKNAVETYLGSLSSPSRALFILHALSHSLHLARDAQVIVSDGYFYKYAATELAYGTDAKAVFGASESFSKPDFTFFLEIDPEEALKRKPKVTEYEGGKSFVEFQKKASGCWEELEKKYGPWVHLRSESSISERVQMILKKTGLE